MYHLILSTLLTFQDPQLQLAMDLSKTNNFQKSEQILRKLDASNSDRNLILFYRLLNNFSQNNKRESEFLSEQIDERGLPIRYQVLTALMRADLQTWNDGDVSDIGRDMKRSRDKLGNEELGKEINNIQKQIVDKLSRLIKEAEDQAANSAKGDGDSKKDGKNKASKPLDESEIRTDGGTGEVISSKMRKLQERWSSLPPRERAASLQQLTSGLSPRHREQIENYFRGLSAAQHKR